MASGFAPFVSLALGCRTIYSFAWRRPAGLTHATEQDRDKLACNHCCLQVQSATEARPTEKPQALPTIGNLGRQINSACLLWKVCGNNQTKSIVLGWWTEVEISYFSPHVYPRLNLMKGIVCCKDQLCVSCVDIYILLLTGDLIIYLLFFHHHFISNNISYTNNNWNTFGDLLHFYLWFLSFDFVIVLQAFWKCQRTRNTYSKSNKYK